MADKGKKVPENVSGKYYVDQNCISCGLCENLTPENFKLGVPYAFVQKQPENAEQLEKVKEALATCPANAIGDDGE
jgi:ferredoxin